jgi:hypothetical protein
MASILPLTQERSSGHPLQLISQDLISITLSRLTCLQKPPQAVTLETSLIIQMLFLCWVIASWL